MRSFTTLAFTDELAASPEPPECIRVDVRPARRRDAPDLGRGRGRSRDRDGSRGAGRAGHPPHAGSAFAGVGVAKDARALLSSIDAPATESARLPRFDAETIGGLRSEAERCWRESANGGVPELHAEFVSPGQLVVHVGARTGDLTASFLALGARVVAVEPNREPAQKRCASASATATT